MITRYGYDVFFTVSALCAVVALLAILFIDPKIIRYGVVLVALVFFGLTLNFFRDPDRTTPEGDRLVVSPADGTVLAVRQVTEKEFHGTEATLVSIFMSPLNVHVNRNPVSGVVRHTRYVKGEYFAAFEDKASEKNEQMIVGIENTHGKVLFKQIAGFLARRIVCTLTPGDSVRAGTRFGMIKFGSRVDVYVPVNAVIRVKAGERTVAGETVLAEFAQ
jgi:phosphatidylserine decarboxylase